MSFIKNIPLRPHHGMCLAYFKGEGYSDGFSAHMQEMLDIFQKGAKIQLHAEYLQISAAYHVPVVMDSDAHFDLLIGEFDLARDLLEKLDFPEELVLNRSTDAIREYVNRKF